MEFWKEVRRQVLTGELSQRAAIKKYNVGWHTLKKILTHAEPPGYRQRKARLKRKLEPFLPVIQQILTADRQAPKKQRHTAKRIFERLRGSRSIKHILHAGRGVKGDQQSGVLRWLKRPSGAASGNRSGGS